MMCIPGVREFFSSRGYLGGFGEDSGVRKVFRGACLELGRFLEIWEGFRS
jgi:hypothetical protein